MSSALTLDRFLPYRLSFTSNLVSDAIAGTYEALFGLKIPDWRLIAVIAENAGGITQLEIGRKTRMDKVTVSRSAISLIDRGLLTRRPNEADLRSHLLLLTSAGRELYETVVPKALELEKKIFGVFSAGELAKFDSMLRQIETLVEQLDQATPA